MLRSTRRRRGVRRSVRAALVAALLLTGGVLVPTASAATSPLVVTPRAGAHVASAPVPVTITAPYAVRSLRVTLNGVNVTSRFSAPNGRGQRSLRASASDALRYGRNVLAVTLRGADGLRRSRVSFTVSRARPLVGAGPDRRVALGQALLLDGRASRPRSAPASPSPAFTGALRAGGQPGSPSGLVFRWRLLSRPAASHATLQLAPTALQPPGASPLALQPARPKLLPDVPGRYVVALTVVDQGILSLVDTVTLIAVIPTPLVPIDTAATVGGHRGIAVGYHPALNGGAAPGPGAEFFPRGAGNALQMVVLDRATLATVATWGGPATATSIATLAQQVKTYDDADLVIITAWADPGWETIFGGAAQALTGPNGPAGLIGASTIFELPWWQDPLQHGQMTFVGVPGFAAGKAWQTSGVPGGAGLSTLAGFLSPDNNDNYSYLGSSPQTFDLGADGQSVSLRLGTATYTASLPAGQGGFTAVYLNGATLQPFPGLGQQTYTTNDGGTPNLSEMARMTADLKTVQFAGVPVLVAIRSIGAQPLAPMGLQPPSYVGPFDGAYAAALDQLKDGIATSGGSAQTFSGMATAPAAANSYSLVGSNFYPGFPDQLSNQGHGADIGSALSPAPSSTRLYGQLIRGHGQEYQAVGAANAPVGGALLQTAMAEPTAWPYANTASGQQALACIGNAQGLGPDPRTAYWTATYSGARWDLIQEAVKEMTPADCPTVSATLFKSVRGEIATEIGWVVNVGSYLSSLTTPFTSDGLSSFADLQTITTNVINAVTPPPKAPTGINVLNLFADVADLLDSFDVPAAGTISAVFFITGDLFSSTQGGPTTDPGEKVEAASDKVGAALAQQLQDIAANNGHLADIIVADYAKLKTVGTLGGCVSGPGCTPQWQFTQDEQNAASRMYQVNATRQIWGGVLPSAYPYVLQTSSNTNSYNGTFEGPQEQISGIGCDFAQPFPVTSPVFLRYGTREVGNTPFLVFSQTDFQGASSPSTNFPPTKLITPLFQPLDPGGNPNKGGLGLDEYDFMTGNWAYTTVTKKVPTPALKAWRGC